MSFEEIEHTADRAFRVNGGDIPDLLANAARAMHALGRAYSATGKPGTLDLEVEGIDPETLLVNWLNEILFLEQERHIVCEDFQICEFDGYRLRAQIKTRECSDSPGDIKAVTFHNLKIRSTPTGLEAEVVVDV